MILHIDIETYSEIDLREVGLYRYAEDFSTELNCVCYAFDDGPVLTWLPGAMPDDEWTTFKGLNGEIRTGLQCPKEIVDHITSGGIVAAHNAQFERVTLSGHVGRRHGIPPIQISQTICTAAKAAAAGLPRSLGEAAKALGSHPKDEDGRINMMSLSKPRKGKEARYSMAEHPDRWRWLIEYCIDDVKAERDLDRRLPNLTPAEQKVYELDQVINGRGIKVDLDAVANVKFLIDQYKADLEARCVRLTGLLPTQTTKLADWVRSNGYPQLIDFQAASIPKAIHDPACPEPIREVLRLRAVHAMKAVEKYGVMERAVSQGDVLRGSLLYYGAGTGRWSSQLVQLQNLYRPAIKDAAVAIDAMAARDLDTIRWLYDLDPMKVFASCIRGMLIPKDGKDFIALDYAGIENRIVAWLFDEGWKLKAFRDFDAGKGADLYKLAYARAFRCETESVTDFQRQIGKVQELSMGFAGGVNAFVTMAGTYKLDLAHLAAQAFPAIPDDVLEEAERAWAWANDKNQAQELPKHIWLVCDSLKRLWRQGHPNTVQGWQDLEDAAVAALKQPGKAFAIPNRKVGFKVKDDWLLMRLPSGRCLSYYKPELKYEEEKPRISYLGINTKTRQWGRTGTFSGKLCENATQATARDVMVNGMFAMEAAHYPVILTVHDEIVAEVPEGEGSVEAAAGIMCELPEWAAGLPVAAAGWRGKRYRK